MTINFIAEVSSNHNQNLERCYSFIETSARMGCAAVKFQLFKIDQLFAPCVLQQSDEHRKRKQWELPTEFLPLLHQKCREHDIAFSCTPFYLEAVNELAPFVSFYKIASYELLWKDLLIACAETGKPVVLSTGMATMKEISEAVETLRCHGCSDLTLLHCVSAYPTPADHCNLQNIQALRDNFDCKVGWSDHSVSPAVIYRAVHKWNVSMIEFHLDLDGKGNEYNFGHCWLPHQISKVITYTVTGLCSDKAPYDNCHELEQSDRIWRADPNDGLRPLRKSRR